MTRSPWIVAACMLPMLLGASLARAQAPGPQPFPMSFFVTSVGIGKGGDLGGLAGADAHCQRLAAAVGGGNKTWHAYLSTQARPGVSPPSTRATASGTGPGTIPRSSRSPPTSPSCTATPIEPHGSAAICSSNRRSTRRAQVINGAGDTAQPARHADRLADRRPRLYGQCRPHLQQLDQQRRRLRPGRPFRPHRRRQHLLELGAPDPRLQPGSAGKHRRGGAVLLLCDQLSCWRRMSRRLRQRLPSRHSWEARRKIADARIRPRHLRPGKVDERC